MSEHIIYKIPYEDNIWFSPAKVITHYMSLTDKERKQYSVQEQQAMKEAFYAANMLLGISEGTHREYWLQMVHPREQRPDICTMYVEPRADKSDHMFIQDLEITEYEDHSQESIPDFLKRTKLTSKKNYTPDTSILCFINKTIPLPDWKAIHKELKGLKSPLATYLLGQTDPDRLTFQLAQVNPVLSNPIVYNVRESAKRWCSVNTKKMKRGTYKSSTLLSEEHHFPFWEKK
ncbi:MAG: hypothetical protein WD000_08215 [Thermodesulfobacteriota bacterium]